MAKRPKRDIIVPPIDVPFEEAVAKILRVKLPPKTAPNLPTEPPRLRLTTMQARKKASAKKR